MREGSEPSLKCNCKASKYEIVLFRFDGSLIMVRSIWEVIYATETSKVPIFEITAFNWSPLLIFPTPSGVPVKIISPGSSVTICET